MVLPGEKLKIVQQKISISQTHTFCLSLSTRFLCCQHTHCVLMQPCARPEPSTILLTGVHRYSRPWLAYKTLPPPTPMLHFAGAAVLSGMMPKGRRKYSIPTAWYSTHDLAPSRRGHGPPAWLSQRCTSSAGTQETILELREASFRFWDLERRYFEAGEPFDSFKPTTTILGAALPACRWKKKGSLSSTPRPGHVNEAHCLEGRQPLCAHGHFTGAALPSSLPCLCGFYNATSVTASVPRGSFFGSLPRDCYRGSSTCGDRSRGGFGAKEAGKEEKLEKKIEDIYELINCLQEVYTVLLHFKEKKALLLDLFFLSIFPLPRMPGDHLWTL